MGAPTFERRLNAAVKVQEAGYPIRIRLDPIVPIDDWEKAYAKTIKSIFDKVSPERMTLGTLRFERGFYNMRNSIFTSGPTLPEILDQMEQMFEPKLFEGSKRPLTYGICKSPKD
ncbi:spore photoproduct lyase family protein [Desulfobacula phenolica]|uniref:spore photoproduct lyase family protein n=1 Tax=Desulfobacula phenolica TaxID=90732 RepID=UPI003898EF14